MQIRKSYLAVVLVLGVFIGSFPRPYGLISFAKQSIFPDTTVSVAPVAPVQIKSHFFNFLLKSYSDNFKYQWVADSKSKYLFTISSDREFEGDVLTGGKDSEYELKKLISLVL